jgi:hypothetical protein
MREWGERGDAPDEVDVDQVLHFHGGAGDVDHLRASVSWREAKKARERTTAAKKLDTSRPTLTATRCVSSGRKCGEREGAHSAR